MTDHRTTRAITVPEIGTIYINAQRWSLTFSDNLHDAYGFDDEGRPLSCFRNGTNYRFGLCGDVLLKTTTPGAPKQRRILTDNERDQIYADVHTWVTRTISMIAPELPHDIQERLERISAWDSVRTHAERQSFQTIYTPISIVPPDQYRALVLQATEGCSWNRCSFCSFYRDRPFRIASPIAFRTHIRQIKAFLGRGLGLRRSIFLGDANALIIPQPRLIDLFEVIQAELPNNEAGTPYGIYAFLDIFGADQKTVEQYQALHERGLQRIYIGLESGSEEVFRLLHKPGSPELCIETVKRIKAAGIQVGIIVLAGAGGESLAKQHVEQSMSTLEAMQLSTGDLVYISPLIVPEGSDYIRITQQEGISPLGDTALEAQLHALKAGARAVTQGKPRVALYHIEEWIY
ncbi:MAG: radical SAM protein [Oscillochloris sp.]|nr:radical SAM protein [Oscillochloris sp.]